MAYGRLDVYWPDGPVESYLLDKQATALGRSPGNDIVLDTTAISRYHVTFTFKNHQILLEDLQSVNGTYVDGERLAPNQPYVLRGGEEIQVGDVRLIFHPPLDGVSATGDTTQRITLSLPTYQIELEGPDLAVSPGAHSQATLKIENVGTEKDHYSIEVNGLPPGWVRAERMEVEVEASAKEQTVLTFKPLRRSETLPGDYPFVVRVRSSSNPTQSIDAPTVLRVLPYSGFGIALGTSRVTDSVKVYVHNQGNAPLSLLIEGADKDHVLRFNLGISQITLGPGEYKTLTGTIQPRRRKLFGPEQEFEFEVQARANNAAGFVASVPGTYTTKGMLPVWVPLVVVPAMILLAAVIVGALVWAILGREGDDDDKSPSPSATVATIPTQALIQSFSIGQQSAILGESTQLTWDVPQSDLLLLTIDHAGTQQQVTVMPDDSPYPLTFDETGVYTLTLDANWGQVTESATTFIEIQPSVDLKLTVVDSDSLVRQVQQTVQVTWTVNGAISQDNGYAIWLTSSDESEPLLAAPLPLSGQQELDVVPDTEEWTVTLNAEGQDQIVSSMTQSIPVEYPICELQATRAIVHSGPGDVYPAIVPPLETSSEGNPSFSPIARDISGNWLQIQIGVDNPRSGWVRRADFSCTNFDPMQLVSTNDFPPPPTTAPRPTVTLRSGG
jgi:pSer/pThr/pTyr-binding forkhead associated (FHA) protein